MKTLVEYLNESKSVEHDIAWHIGMGVVVPFKYNGEDYKISVGDAGQIKLTTADDNMIYPKDRIYMDILKAYAKENKIK